MRTKPFLSLLVLMFLTSVLQAQISIGFDKARQVIKYESGDSFKIPYTLQIDGNKFPSKANNISVKITTDNESLNSFKVSSDIAINQSITKGHLEFKRTKDHQGNLQSLLDSIIKHKGIVELTIESLSEKQFELEKDTTKKEIVKIELKDHIQTVILNTEKKNKSSKYNFFMGANFNFGEKVKVKSFYSEIDVFLPGLFFKNRKGTYWGGIRAGIYRNSSTTLQKDKERDDIIFLVEDENLQNDSISLIAKRVIRTPETTSENLGFYGQLLFRIFEDDAKSFQTYLALHTEIIQRTETTKFNFKDTLHISQNYIPRDSLLDPLLRRQLRESKEFTDKLYSSYFGVGVPMKYTDKNIEVFLNPVLGYGDTGRRSRNGTGQFFGLFQFYLMEQKHGIKISGEVREYFSDQNPQMVVNLSKRFDIESLLDSNKGKSD